MRRQQANIAIVGASVAGLALAAFLKRAGFNMRQVQIFDRTPWNHLVTSKRAAFPIGLWKNGLECLKQLDSDQKTLSELIASGLWMDGPSSFTDHKLQTLACPSTLQQGDFLFVELNRIMSLLRGYLGDQVEIQHREIRRHSESSEQVTLTFSDGKQVSCDYLIYANGLSNFRDNVQRYRFLDYTVVRGIAKSSQFKEAFQAWGPHRIRFAVVPYKHDSCIWYAALPGMDGFLAGHQFFFLEEFVRSRWHQGIVDIIEQVNYDELLIDEAYTSLDHPFSSSRVTYIGDAAHATDPIAAQGVGIAIEDALELTYQFKYNHQEDLQVFQTFESIRRSRVDAVRFASIISTLCARFISARDWRKKLVQVLPERTKTRVCDSVIQIALAPSIREASKTFQPHNLV